MSIRRLFGGFVAFFLLAVTGVTLLRVTRCRADEGMWTFDNPPLKELQKRYGFTPTQAWLDHVRLASVRFNDGGSGSFVSAHGLVLTNHHVALTQLQKVSSATRDYVKNGFYARTPSEELKCPDLELNVLVYVEDVTKRVQGAVTSGMSESGGLKARKAEIAKIEKESTEKTGLRSDVITLYQGGEYWLYRYKKYTDIRLVFAPEQQIAFFGGDPDNFTYPRYDIDFALFRVYENGKPVDSKDYLKWNVQGATEGELVFVSGNPGSTSRLDTVAQIETQRDNTLSLTMKTLERRLQVAKDYAALGPEQARQATRQIFGVENSLKAYRGMYQGLRDASLTAKKLKEEEAFRALAASKPDWQKAYGDAWDSIAAAETKYREILMPVRFRSLGWSGLSLTALDIVQYVAEVRKPDGERLAGFHDSQLESLRFRLFSPAPVYREFEQAMLTGFLRLSLDELGPDDPFIQAVLGGHPPDEVAKEVTSETKLVDASFRKALVEGGESAVQASTDPLIVLARKADPWRRQMIKAFEDQVESVETPAGEKIGEARFAAYGKSHYPDATFTLRLSFGAVKGYPMNGTQAPPKTTFYGLYDRAYSFDLKAPYNLPERYLERKTKLDLAAPVDFVSTCDIIGGNSGSPVINKQGELVGLIFDGNIESLAGDYAYSEVTSRAVAVHSAAIIEVLRKLYDAGALADELLGN
ncbi:MAG: S46 family peptidase [Terriglobia bacterium]